MRSVLAIVLWVAVAACSSQPSARVQTSTTPLNGATPAGSAVIESGCGSTPVYRGSIPGWLDDAGGHNNPSSLPYVVTHPSIAAGFLFNYPLRAGHPENPSNKILWVVRPARNGADLTVDAHPLGASTPALHETHPANSGPGEIYPDGVDVPTAGCWHFDLRWAGNHTQVELNYS